MTAEPGRILVVDDNELNRDLLCRRLFRHKHLVVTAENGYDALSILGKDPFDLILLDIMMPGMNGYQVLEKLKSDARLRHIPVLMVSALDDIDSVVRCIELGAEDYLLKPFNPTILRARIDACLEKKRLRDQERAFLSKLQQEQEKSEQLLLNILPPTIAERLKRGEQVIADNFAEVTVLFADIVNFTELSADLPPTVLVDLLNEIFSSFDQIAERHQLEKIKTIGDAYLAVGGLPDPRSDHAEAIAQMALDIRSYISEFAGNHAEDAVRSRLNVRIGINTGPVGAGVIGIRKFTYDIWGDTVNTASRMESQGMPGQIQVTETTYDRLKTCYEFKERGLLEVKGKGEMMTYFLVGQRSS